MPHVDSEAPGRPATRRSLALRLALLAASAAILGSGCSPQTELLADAPATAAVPASLWSADDLRALLAAIEGASAEGLNPNDYRTPELVAAARDGRTGTDTDALAERAALALARDYLVGRVADRRAFDWHIAAPQPDPAELAAALDKARQEGRLQPWLASLLPTAPAYRALRAALVRTPAGDVARRDRIRANMERWRWMPRDFGAGTHVYANVPSYQVRLVADGQEQASYVAVVGAPDTPTPALAASVKAVVVNPWWYVPASLIEKGEVRSNARAARRGFVFRTRADGTLSARQKPGPDNSLGRIKIEMPNPHAIYMHDTPARALFARADRARSHGCLRVQNIEDLAARLAGDPAPLASALAGEDTRTFRVDRSFPVYVVYFTIDADGSGALRDYPDIYDRDADLVAALDGRAAPRPKVILAAATPARKAAAPARSNVAVAADPAPAPSVVSLDIPAPPEAPSTPAAAPSEEPAAAVS